MAGDDEQLAGVSGEQWGLFCVVEYLLELLSCPICQNLQEDVNFTERGAIGYVPSAVQKDLGTFRVIESIIRLGFEGYIRAVWGLVLTC